MFPVRPSVNFVKYRPTLVAKQETGRVLIVRQDGHPQTLEVQSVNRVKLVLSVMFKVKFAKIAPKASSAKAKKTTAQPRPTQPGAPTAPPAGPPMQAAPNVNSVVPERTELAAKHVL